MKIDERHDDQRLHILDSTAKLILADADFFPSLAKIAKKASISSSQLHYYFDSKEDLMQSFNAFAVALWESRIHQLFKWELPLEDHIERFIDYSFDMTSKYPFLEHFLSIDKRCIDLIGNAIDALDEQAISFCTLLDKAMRDGKIYTMDPIHIIINLLSITDQPFRIISYRNSDEMELRTFAEHFRSERKELILRTVFI